MFSFVTIVKYCTEKKKNILKIYSLIYLLFRNILINSTCRQKKNVIKLKYIDKFLKYKHKISRFFFLKTKTGISHLIKELVILTIIINILLLILLKFGEFSFCIHISQVDYPIIFLNC